MNTEHLKNKSIVPIDKQKVEKIRSYVNLIRKSFECSICIDYYVEPVITNCQHTFCKTCIENYIGNKRFQNCPLCKASINLRSLKNFDSLNSYVSLSKTLAESFEADEADNQKLDPGAMKAMFSKMVEKLNRLTESPPDNAVLEEVIQPTNNEGNVTPTTPLQKRKRSLSGEQSMSSKKAKQSLQQHENTVASSSSSGLREIAVNRVQAPAVALTNRLAETPALRTEKATTATTRLHVVEHSHSKSSINIVKLSTANTTHLLAATAAAETSPRTAPRRDESNKENMPKTPVTPKTPATSKNDNPLKFKKESSDILSEPNFTNKTRLNFEKSELPRAAEKAINNKESPKETTTRKSPRLGQVPSRLVEIPPDPAFTCAPLEPVEYDAGAGVVNETAFPDLDLNAVHSTIQPEERSHVKTPNRAEDAPKVDESPRPQKVPIRFTKLGQLAKKKTEVQEQPVARKELKEASAQTDPLEPVFPTEIFTELNRSLLEREIFEVVFSDLQGELVDQVMRERQAMFESFLTKNYETAPQAEPPPHLNDDAHQPSTNLYVPISTIEPSEPSHANESICEPTVLLTNASSDQSDADNSRAAKNSTSSGEAKATASSRQQFMEILNTANRFTNSASNHAKFSSKSRFSLSTNKKRAMPTLEFLDGNKTYAGSQLDDSFAPSSFRPKTTKSVGHTAANRTLLNETVLSPESRPSAMKPVSRVSLDATMNMSIAAGLANNSSIAYQHGQRINDSISEEPGSPDRSKSNAENALPPLLIITETPVKGSDDGEYEHDESLSKTATRVEFALGTSLNDTSVDENRTMRHKTTLDETSDARRKSVDAGSEAGSRSKTVINETVCPDEEAVVQEVNGAAPRMTIVESSSGGEPEFSRPLPAAAANTRKHLESFLMNSFNVTASLDHDSPPLLPTLATSSMQSEEPKAKNAKLAVPHAQDFLGTSFAHSETTFSSSGETQPRKSVGSRSSDESGIADKTLPPAVQQQQPDVTIGEQSTIVVSSTIGPFFATRSKSATAMGRGNEVLVAGKLVSIKQEKAVSPQHRRQNQSYEFVCSLLKADMKANVKKLAELVKAKVSNEITETTTHLVVESDDQLLCGVTSKYLKAVSRKIWVISGKWVVECLQKKELANPLPYEIRGDGIFGEHLGPHRSRTSGQDFFLFSSYEILFMEKFDSDSINLAEMTELAQLNGATIVKKAKEFGELRVRIVLLDDKVPRITVKNANMMYETAKIHCLMVSWFLDSLACYNVKEFEQYALYKISPS